MEVTNELLNILIARKTRIFDLKRDKAQQDHEWLGRFLSRFTIHYLLLQLIGSDRSAFAEPAVRGR